MAASLPLDASLAIMAAIRAAILADATLPGLLVGFKVLDKAPSSHPTPYISMDVSSKDWSTSDTDGQEFSINLNVWHEPSDQTPETATARQIMGLLRSALHTASLTLDSPFHAVLIRVENQIGPYRDPDGKTMHGVLMLRADIDHA